MLKLQNRNLIVCYRMRNTKELKQLKLDISHL